MPFGQSNYQVRVAIKVLNKSKLSDEKAIAKLSDELINVNLFEKKAKNKLIYFNKLKIGSKSNG
jgi:hypothetical protein